MLTRHCAAFVAARLNASPENALPLPLHIICEIFLFVPPDQRLLLALVSRFWRAALDDVNLWTSVSLSRLLACAFRTPCCVRSPKERVGSLLISMSAGGRRISISAGALSRGTVEVVVAENWRSLRLLNACYSTTVPQEWRATPWESVTRLRSFAPHATLVLDVNVTPREAVSVFSGANEWLHVRLFVEPDTPYEWPTDTSIVQLASVLATAQPPLRELVLYYPPLDVPGALAAVVAVFKASRHSSLRLYHCSLGDSTDDLLPALYDGSLTSLVFCTVLMQTPTALFVSALQSSMLTRLMLDSIGLWNDVSVGISVVRAVTIHPTSAYLDVAGNQTSQSSAIGAALGALVAADAAPLATLVISSCDLGHAGRRFLSWMR